MSSLRELLSAAIAQNASDIHLKLGRPPFFRVHGKLTPQGERPLTSDELLRVGTEIIPAHARRSYEANHEADFSLTEEGVGRFRCTVFNTQMTPSFALRHVKTKVPTFDELGLPPILKGIALAPRGIVLAAGTTGCGKSTTLAALLQRINQNLNRRIITIEDPIEYVFTDEQSVISQREVGLDTHSFNSGLRHVLRQDPDIIMIGEMRDAESFIAALQAAETGHLIFSTLHTDTAGQTLPRILNFFPPNMRDQIRMSLAINLQAVICQRLVPAVSGRVVPAVEIMLNTPTVQKLIEKNLLEKLPAAIETGAEDGMLSFNQSLYQFIKNGTVSEEAGLQFATNAEALKMNLKGIFLDEARRILSN
ncbi:MAG: PilT/PilU family type 4a pilus ATPase [Verrucomicrobia bacterium]|nr:MAG: PilT/PilU family type 4a pilus ATPase [Verrucomicrobiota bacterium]